MIPLTADLLEHTLTGLRDEWIDTGKAETAAAINNGLCAEFVYVAVDRLKQAGVETQGIYDLDLGNFLAIYPLDDDASGRPLDRALLETHRPAVAPPPGWSWEALDEVALQRRWESGMHAWLTFQGLHYDSESTRGVANFLELGIFQRHIAGAHLSKEANASEGLSDQLTPKTSRVPRRPR